MSKPAKEKLPDFETAMSELEALVDKMEQGDLSLEDSLKQYERGMTLTRHCQSLLENAELKVKMLGKDNQLTDFDADAE
ncbi:MAG TPA: exodeoxyribonuclease VII small subunit [Gammaproteobacteria bacterium]|nr:exodeoxyribonuclease VII small subunit [Gammaproteobacteria bacterium]